MEQRPGRDRSDLRSKVYWSRLAAAEWKEWSGGKAGESGAHRGAEQVP
jgi:hypothetical protein